MIKNMIGVSNLLKMYFANLHNLPLHHFDVGYVYNLAKSNYSKGI